MSTCGEAANVEFAAAPADQRIGENKPVRVFPSANP